jgi:NAD(P)-dependent dehydrogenase (short-subunit alcohol dehydrogenase family)
LQEAVRMKDGRHVLVTGASRGIGRAIALHFAAGGCLVSVAGRDAERVGQVVREIEENGGKASPVLCDLSTRAGVEKCVDASRLFAGDPDVLVNNAGIYPSSPFLKTSEEEWNRIMRICLDAVFHCSQIVLPGMIGKGRGWIVNMASVDGKTPGTCNAAYSASKAAVISLTRSMAVEMAQHGVYVNAVAPGWVGTERVFAEDRWKQCYSQVPLGRVAEPEEIAEAVSWLCSDSARYITGETLSVNGGAFMD